MKTILVLGGGSSQLPFIEFCLKMGHPTHVLDGDSNSPASSITANLLIFKKIDISDIQLVFKYAKNINPDAVIAPSNDAGLFAATYVANELNLPGPGEFATKYSRDKFKFRQLLSKSGISTPWYVLSEPGYNHEKIMGLIPSFPCVVKPNQGSGSKGVRYLENFGELGEYVTRQEREGNKGHLLFEEFVPGTEYSLEGIVQNKKLIVIGVCQKTRSSLPSLVDTRVQLPSNLDDKNMESAISLAEQVVSVLMVENAPIHLEFIVSPTFGIVAVECAVRAGGFNLFNKLIPRCTGYNTLQAQLHLILGLSIEERNVLITQAGILEFPQPKAFGLLQEISYNADLFKVENQGSTPNMEIAIYKKKGDRVGPSSNGADRVGHVMVFAPTLSEAEEKISNLDIQITLDH
jgi:biotin carboxylase